MPPDSHFVANRQLFAETSLKLVLQRLRGASTGGQVSGLHGTNIVGRRRSPAARRSPPAARTPSPRRPNLAFDVTVEDSGDAQEVGIAVTLTLEQDGAGKPIVQDEEDPVINPGEKKTVTF